MLCERCQKREANVFYTEIVNGIKREEKLCQQCANSNSTFYTENPILGSEYSIGGLLANLLQGYTNSGPTMTNTSVVDTTCSKCNLSYREFLQNGRFGCDNCYKDFQKELDVSLRGIQGAEHHTGKRPVNLGKRPTEELTEDKEVKNVKKDSSVEALSEVEKLQMDLQEAIKKEEFEEAAKLRDLIREMKKEDASNA